VIPLFIFFIFIFLFSEQLNHLLMLCPNLTNLNLVTDDNIMPHLAGTGIQSIDIYILDGGLCIYQLMLEQGGSMLLPNLARW
jgi:hypothetical protein